MNGDHYRLFFDDGLLFIRSLISFASDLQRVVNRMCQKFEVDFLLMQSYMNFPMVDNFMFKIGKAFNNKFIKVSLLSDRPADALERFVILSLEPSTRCPNPIFA